MSDNALCCGCSVESDYGTSIVIGDGSSESPYSVTQVDPLFNRPVVRAVHQQPTSIPNSTPTALSFTGVLFDTHHMFTMTSPTRLTIPIAGLYLMGYHLEWESAAAAYDKKIAFRSNGSATLDEQTQIYTSLNTQKFNGNYLWFFDVNDYVEVVATQTSGVAKAISGYDSITNFKYGFWMMYMGKKV